MEAAGIDTLRPHLHAMWSSVADGWGEHAEYADARGAHIAEALLGLTSPGPGDRVLELACGPGGVGLAAAPRVGDEGEVVLSDVAPEMTAIAVSRAAALGLGNVSARDLDLEEIDEPDASFDVVVCREGLMFATDPQRALRESERVLRPGGRFAAAVWGPRERNPWLGLVFDAVSAQIGQAVPPPGIPGPFALSDADRLTGLLADAGLEDVVVSEVPVPLRAGSFADWWTRTSALAGPLAKMLEAMPSTGRQAIEDRLREAVRPYETSTGLDLPGLSLLASGRHA